ncbi:MAG: hypothetical protein QJR03_15465 [Sphaerobacter sp.]|nr:hypothetical protein [Sphaerobacter sp.]
MRAEPPPRRAPAPSPLAAWLTAPATWRLLVSVLLLALGIGLGLGWAAARLGQGDHLSVGNTGGSLSTLIRVSGKTIVVGGSASVDDLAEFVDRTTLPWQRHIHLLVVPADDELAMGALALVERGGVGAVAVLGLPGNDPVWTRLERAASDHGIEHRYLTGAHRVPLSDGSDLLLAAPAPDDARGGARALLRHGQVRVRIAGPGASPDDHGVTGEPATALIQVLAVDAAPQSPVPVVVRPHAERAGTLAPDPPAARFVTEIARGDRISISLERDTLRLPSDALRPVAQPTVSD